MLSLWKVVSLAVDSASKLLQGQLRGVGDEGDDENAEPADKAVVFSQLGLVARPVIRATLRALGYQHGDEVWVLKLWDKSKQPSGVNPGDVALFGIETPGATVWIRSSGKIEIKAANGQNVTVDVTGGGKVIFNGGTLDVARKTDSIQASATLTTWMTQVSTAINAIAPGSVAPPIPPNPIGSIATGNPSVLA